MKYFPMLVLGLSGMLAAAGANAACWAAVPQASKITFTVKQAGAPLTGTFGDYNALVCIGSADRIRVQVRTASVDTKLPELNQALRGADFFDSARWPKAVFESDSIRILGTGRYQVQGSLTLRNVTRRVSVPFTFRPVAGGGAQLEGQLSIRRLDYGIGRGQWADTRWVGNQVDINFSVMLKAVHRR